MPTREQMIDAGWDPKELDNMLHEEAMMDNHPLCQQEQEPDPIDKMCGEELRVHARQLEAAVKNLVYIIQCVDEATGNATSRAELYEARQLAGMDSAQGEQDHG